ncbi:hypothetical protein [Williamsia sterculiae]|uniref:Uncharacterized protein n=1 Tax=Williamsia sterculiae TaxID=1344003 RepID=A0A1N7GFX5_9NOCA|nr:hypothetical protein [Williamsia sterculiae]SIS11460.1 hypothetical protein SAMN05445060_2736 [Williamsia sterculiae]
MNLQDLMGSSNNNEPRIVQSRDVPSIEAVDQRQRRELLAKVNTAASLVKVSRLLAKLDLSVISHTYADVERAFAATVSAEVRSETEPLITAGNALLHPVSLLGAIKEVIAFGGSEDAPTITDEQLLQLLLSVADENEVASTPPTGVDRDEQVRFITLSHMAQHSMVSGDPIEFAATIACETWLAGWSEQTSKKVRGSLEVDPAAQWEAITGVSLDDYFALGYVFYNLWRREGFKTLHPDFLLDRGIPSAVVEFLIERCSLSLSEIRDLLLDQDGDEATTPWTRYKLQQCPFVRLEDDTLVPVRFQFVVQRIFGDHLFMESHDMLKQTDPKKADYYASAMRDIFEQRVGEVLQRICEADNTGETVLVTEQQMKRAWGKSKGRPPSVCDFVLFRGNTCVLVDANMRYLPQEFAEGTANYHDFEKQIEERYTKTKFGQLLSTVDLLLKHGWNRTGARVTNRTRFVPFVVAPDAGLPTDMTVDSAMFVRAFELVKRFNVNPSYYRVFVPGVLSWRNLAMLEGYAEKSGNIFPLLHRWRNILPVGQRLPVPLQEYIETNYPGSTAMSQYFHRVGWDFFEYLMNCASQLQIEAMPESLREDARRHAEEMRAARPTFDNRFESQFQDWHDRYNDPLE